MNLKKEIYNNKVESLGHINIGSGREQTIKQLAETIKEVVDYKGQIKFDPMKPDGSLKKLINSNRLNSLGWKAKTNLKEGIIQTYKSYTKIT